MPRKSVVNLISSHVFCVSRSAVDEYCPPDQVDSIENRVIRMLTDVYGEVDIHYDYKDINR